MSRKLLIALAIFVSLSVAAIVVVAVVTFMVLNSPNGAPATFLQTCKRRDYKASELDIHALCVASLPVRFNLLPEIPATPSFASARRPTAAR